MKLWDDCICSPSSEGLLEALIRDVAMRPLLLDYAREGRYKKVKEAINGGDLCPQSLGYIAVRFCASVNAVDPSDHTTALFWAAKNNHINCTSLLLKRGANPNWQDTLGQTAVHAACMGGSLQCLKLLLDYGGNTNIRSLLGELPEDVADRLKDSTGTLLALLQGKDKQSIQKSTSKLKSFRNTGKLLGSEAHASFEDKTDASALSPVINPLHDMFGLHFTDMRWFDQWNGIALGNFSHNGRVFTMKQVGRNYGSAYQGLLLSKGIRPVCLMDEVNISSQSCHQNIISLVCVLFENLVHGTLLVLEHAPYGTLYHILHGQQEAGLNLTMKERVNIIVDACRGLLHLHQVMNEVHCTVTSHAVYVCHSRRRDLIGKLGDLFFAQQRNETYKSPINSCSELLPWMAPEVIEGHAPTQASDVYSLSVALWEVLTGSLPWSHLSHSELRHAVVTQGRRLDLCNPLIPTKLAEELKECFKEPSDRPTSLELYRYLQHFHKCLEETSSLFSIDPEAMETFSSVSVSSFIAESASAVQSPVMDLQSCSSSATLLGFETDFSLDRHSLDYELQHITIVDCELDGDDEESNDSDDRNDSTDGNDGFGDRDTIMDDNNNDDSDGDISDYDDPDISLPTHSRRVLRHSSLREVRPLERPSDLADKLKLLMDDQSTNTSTFMHTDVQGGLTHPMSSLNYITQTWRRVSMDRTPPRLAKYSSSPWLEGDQEQSMTDCCTEPPSPAHSLLATVHGKEPRVKSPNRLGNNAKKSFWSKLWAE